MNYHTQKEVGTLYKSLDLQVMDFMRRDEGHVMYREMKIVSVIDKSIDVVPPLVYSDPQEIKYYAGELASN